jgi:hypothetical protein
MLVWFKINYNGINPEADFVNLGGIVIYAGRINCCK